MVVLSSYKVRNAAVGGSLILAVVFIYILMINRSDWSQILKGSRARQSLNSVPVLNESNMDSIEVVSYLAKEFLVPPSPRNVPYNLENPQIRDPSIVQAFLIERILGGQRDGFFIECGAHDGEYMSNTLVFEREYNWTGLLIEPLPRLYTNLVAKMRKAYLSPTCLSRTTHPEKVRFTNQDVGSHIVEKAVDDSAGYLDGVQCFPLYSYLLALNRTTVDYFSLDVESNELDVLKTIPWDKVNIRTLSVEFFLVREGKTALKTYMEAQGYYLHSQVMIRPDHGADDFIFVKST